MTVAEAVGEQGRWLERVLDYLGIGVFTIEHATGKVVRANEAYARLLGFRSAADAVGRSVLEHYADPSERSEIEARLRADEVFRTTGIARLEVRRLRLDTREPFTARLAIRATFDGAGAVVTMDCVVEDVSARPATELAFRASEERFRILFETADVGMVLTDLDRRIQRVNGAFCRFVGRSQAELVGRDVREYLHPERWPTLADEVQRGRSSATGEYRFVRGDGTVVTGLVTVSGLSNGDGVPHSLVAVVHDVTEARRNEQALARLATLESLGVLAGGIAHDFNNILAVIMGSVSLAAGRPADARQAELLDEALKACERARDLARQLVTFGRGGSPVTKTSSVGEVVREAVGFSSRGSNVAVALTLPERPVLAELDPGQLSQVVHNLILNAQQAMPAGGTVRVTVTEAAMDSSAVAPLPAGTYARIQVADTGVGIPPEHLERVFEPYFTTKQAGSGLGLATSHSIVRRHGGTIRVTSESGRGTTFDVYLPVSAAARPRAPSSQAQRAAGTPARVLVMDDEPAVRTVTARALRAAGHEVTVTEDADAAEAAFRAAAREGRPFGVVLLDLTIRGGRGGFDALEALRAADPTVRAVLMTGYSPDVSEERLRERGFASLLAKPFTAESLAAAVRAALDGDAR